MTKDISKLLSEKRAEILQIAAAHGARNIRLFGSVRRGEAGPDSDVDFLIDLEAGRSLLDQAAIIAELEDLLGRTVDVVLERSLKSRVRERILSEAVAL